MNGADGVSDALFEHLQSKAIALAISSRPTGSARPELTRSPAPSAAAGDADAKAPGLAHAR